MKYLLTILINLSVLDTYAQYTYFNQTYGEFGDQETEHVTNVEVIGDTIFMFGGIDNDEIPFSLLLRAINSDGMLLFEKIIPLNNTETYIGYGSAVTKTEDSQFVFTQGAVDNGLLGYAIKYDSNLDTLWTRTYSLNPNNTYFRTNTSDETGIIVLNEEFGTNAVGTFIMKMDFDGNVLWNKPLHDVSEGIVYENNTVLKLNNGYLIGGHKKNSPWSAIITKTDLEGTLEWEYYADTFIDNEGEQASTIDYRLTELPNGEIVGGHIVYYEYYGPTTIPDNNPLWYRSLHLSKINVADTSLYWEHDYFTDYEFTGSVLWKILPTEENGIIAMGGNGDYDQNAWVAKIDSTGELNWFNFYTLDISQTQESYDPYDIEQTSDGGFVIVGKYFSYNEDSFNKSWVMKIDACGDVEWQGCDYVGIQESKKQQYKIYPNPTTDYIIIEGEYSHKARVYVYDLLGNMVVRQRLTHSGRVNLTSLSTGVYSLVMEDAGELRSVGKIAVEN